MSKIISFSKIGKDLNSIVVHRPKEFVHPFPEEAIPFINKVEIRETTGFKMSDILTDYIGLAAIEQKEIEKKVEASALEKIKEIQEEAYAEAFELGKKEGTELAISQAQEEIGTRLEKIDQFVEGLFSLRKKVSEKNEAELMELIYHVASQIAITEVKADKNVIVNLVDQVIQTLQVEEQVTIRASEEDIAHLESLREQGNKKYEFLEKAKLLSSETITSGGCFVETNHGMVNATIEERVLKAYSTLMSKAPKID